ncbi:MAG: YceG family protein [Prevotella sp.]|nr:YceG family protein [Prevotella sp.]
MIFEGFSTENKKLVQTVTTSSDTFNKDIFETHSQRLLSRGGHFTPEQLIPVYFAALLGAPSGEDEKAGFHNMLYSLREDLIKCTKLLFYSEYELKPPTPDELSVFDGISVVDGQSFGVLPEELAAAVNVPGDEVRTRLARETLPLFLKGMSGRDALSAAQTLIVWMNRCLGSEAFRRDHTEIPVLLYYGNITPAETAFLHFMSRLGIDVLYICSNLSGLAALKQNNLEGRMQIFELPCSVPVAPYPDKPVRTKLATAAYNASKELNNILYNNDTIFRDFQFSDMQSLTLKTTLEEIDVLWHQPARYRTGFAANGSKVTVPNIFAKISGVKDGNLNAYWDSVRWKLSPYARVLIKSPSYKKYGETKLDVYKPYYTGEQINKEKLKNSPLNKYGYLSDSLQTLILNKMQEAVDAGLLKIDRSELLPLVIYVGMNMDREVLKLLQKYDFTKDIPKLIIIDVIEDTFSKVECVQIVLYNLLGFDILVCTPTGYRNIETFVSDAAFETHIMNEFEYNVHIPKLRIPDSIPEPSGKGLFGKLFKKGRK